MQEYIVIDHQDGYYQYDENHRIITKWIESYTCWLVLPKFKDCCIIWCKGPNNVGFPAGYQTAKEMMEQHKEMYPDQYDKKGKRLHWYEVENPTKTHEREY